MLLTLVALSTAVLITGSEPRPRSLETGLGSSTSGARAADRQGASPPLLGIVLFGDRLGSSQELETLRTQFRSGDTIAWQAEFAEPLTTAEVTVVIAWQSIRERMELTRETVTFKDAGLTRIVRDQVSLDDLVPTAGLYSVSYFAADAKLAEGVFEVLPPDR